MQDCATVNYNKQDDYMQDCSTVHYTVNCMTTYAGLHCCIHDTVNRMTTCRVTTTINKMSIVIIFFRSQ